MLLEDVILFQWVFIRVYSVIYSRMFFVPDTELICKSIKGLIVIEDWHTLGYDFSKNITAWRENVVK